MRRAMMDLLKEMMTTRKGCLDEKDVEWARELLKEVRSRVLSLTPHRMDLHASFCDGFDVELIVQMLQHDAMEDTEFVKVGCFLLDRIGMLCAPSQDDEIRTLRYGLLSGSVDFPSLLFQFHSIADEIESLSRSKQSESVKKAIQKKQEGQC